MASKDERGGEGKLAVFPAFFCIIAPYKVRFLLLTSHSARRAAKLSSGGEKVSTFVLIMSNDATAAHDAIK